jgi:hypothetical protein
LNQANPDWCEQIHLTPIADTSRDFEEFPSDPELARFDRSDRKWVAVARASADDPVILNAVDSDWWEYRDRLARHGVRIDFLCSHLMPGRPGDRVTG